MQPLPSTTSVFAADQAPSYAVEFWDTPFVPIESDIASNGIIMDIREPLSDGTWTLKAALVTAANDGGAGVYAAFNTNTGSQEVITGGRTANLAMFWGGGAPGMHGAMWSKKIAYHFRLYARSIAGRGWFSAADPLLFTLAIGGSGYFCLTKTAGASTTVVPWLQGGTYVNGVLGESDFLNNSLRSTALIDLDEGDCLDLYYVQDNEVWGGFVVKAGYGALPVANEVPFQSEDDEDYLVRLSTYWREQPVVGCGLFDDGAPPSKRTLTTIRSIDLEQKLGASARATFVLPLQNTVTSDGSGWEWVTTGAGDPGLLRNHDEAAAGAVLSAGAGDVVNVHLDGHGRTTSSTATLAGFSVSAYNGTWTVTRVDDDNFTLNSSTFTTAGTPNVGVVLGLSSAAWSFDLKRSRLVRIKMGFVGELYPVFTGFIDDFEIGQGEITVNCLSFEQRLLDQFVKNYPDKISYMAAGYRKRSGTTEPVYEIPAFDNWPIEYALRDLVVRAGIDESRTLRPLQKAIDGVLGNVVYGGQTYRKCRARSLAGTPLRLERTTHYGNTGITFNELKPKDDEYIFKPENTAEIWKQCREYADRYGFDARFDEVGDLWLQPRNNPHYALNITDDSPFTIVGGASASGSNPSAYGGTYRHYTDAGGAHSVTVPVRAARIDVSVPRGPSYGSWTATVKHSGATVGVPQTITPSNTAEEFFYDYRSTVDGTNTTVTTLYTGPYDDYVVELTFTGAGGTVTRLLDCLFLYHTDVAGVLYPQDFATDVNAISVNAKSSMDEMRNFVIVVGRRRATVTDSAKLLNNPENPEGEFVVAAATDNKSITLPSSTNFVGYPRESVIYDNKITDQDFAEYVARTFIYRQRMPGPSATIEHTLVPVIQLRDPIYAVEVGFGTVGAYTYPGGTRVPLYVTGIRHRIDNKQATTNIETTVYPEFPSYEPREDIDIADFGNNPVINVEVSYTSLDGALMTNLGAAEARTVESGWTTGGAAGGDGGIVYASGLTVDGNDALVMTGYPWPPIPGTVQITVAPSDVIPGVSSSANTGILWHTGDQSTIHIDALERLLTVADDDDYGVYGQWRMTMSAGPGTMEVGPRFQIPRGSGYGAWATGGVQAYYDLNITQGKICVTLDEQRADYEINGVGNASIQYGLVATVYYYLSTVGDGNWKTNTPYHHLFDVDYRDSSPKLVMKWHEGDDGVTAYGRKQDTFMVRYRPHWPAVNPYSGGCPFYDPYTSELGNLVEVTFDALKTGLYRISVCDKTGAPVAWLTEATTAATDPEVHWQYFSAGVGKLLYWDGVDQVGDWNRRQSDEYAALTAGAFGADAPTRVGSGFYVWNEEIAAGSSTKLTLISNQRDANSERPLFGHGTYGLWHIKFEVMTNDELLTVRTDKPYERNVETTYSVLACEHPEVRDDTAGAYIYTHLSEPTKVEILDVKDWKSTDDWTGTEDDDEGEWEAGSDNLDATVNNSKPTRLRFKIIPRPGLQWDTHQDEVSVKLVRQAHLRAHIFDMFAQFDGVRWAPPYGDDDHNFLSRRIVTRRLVNDTHTFSWEDDSYRLGSSFKTEDNGDGLEWVFLPGNCRKDFRGRENEPLVFGDYLQLEEVPGWSRELAGAYSTYILGFINYLFYLSAYTQDRSGRQVWCLNRRFVDKSKILKNTEAHWWDIENANPTTAATSTTYRNEWPDDLPYQQRRTIITRQWTDSSAVPAGPTEGTWRATQTTDWNLSDGVGEELLRHKWKDHNVVDANDKINGTLWSTLGLEADKYTQYMSVGEDWLPVEYRGLARQLGTCAEHSTSPTTSLGNWDWEHADKKTLWIPCVTRDWYPYFQLPPMVDRLTPRKHLYEIGAEQCADDHGDAAAGGSTTWGGNAPDMTDTGGDNRHPQIGCFNVPWGRWDNEIQYIRQDEMVHYEDLRGMHSRGKHPQNAPIRVNPVQPYYVNWFKYDGLSISHARVDGSGVNPHFGGDRILFAYLAKANIDNAFQGTFRREYLWESGTMFPAERRTYRELLNHTNGRLTQYDLEGWRSVVLDNGAWAGWKDDYPVDDENDADYKLWRTGSVFVTQYHPLAVGPQLVDNTTDLIFHMVLLNERRQVAAI